VIRLALAALDEGSTAAGSSRSTATVTTSTARCSKLRWVLRVGQERLTESKRHKLYQRLRAADTADEVGAAKYAVDLLRRARHTRARHRPPPPRRLLRLGRDSRGRRDHPAGSQPTTPGRTRSWRSFDTPPLQWPHRERQREDQDDRRAARGFRNLERLHRPHHAPRRPAT
jgi:hypothetical protein